MQSRNVAIIGAGGMLGRELVLACAARGIATFPFAGRAALDITDYAASRETLLPLGAQVVLNAAGYTDVDGAEANPAHAFAVNGGGVASLAKICREMSATLVHFSTDYVFDGRAHAPIEVETRPNPINIYGSTKLAGEHVVRAIAGDHLIIRSSWLFAPEGENFVRTILALAAERDVLDVVVDQIGRPTSCRHLADMTLDLLDRGARGTLHATNNGFCSWHELAREVVRSAGLACDVRPCDSSQFPRPARRPAYSVLDLSKTIELIGAIPDWRQAFDEVMEEMVGAPDRRAGVADRRAAGGGQ